MPARTVKHSHDFVPRVTCCHVVQEHPHAFGVDTRHDQRIDLPRVNAAMAMPDVKKCVGGVGAEDGGGPPQQVADFIRADRVKWARVVKEANVKADA